MSGVRIGLARGLRGRIDGDTRRALARAARRGARRLGFDPGAIAVRLIDDAEMIELHRRHLGTAVPTDVLSFVGDALGEAAFDDDDDAPEIPMPTSIGDIAIDWDQVERQAEAADAGALAREATSLLVHGLCHLAGHDHGTPAEARRMLAAERRVARAVGLDALRRDYGRRR